jgi:hypothetical protein
MCFWGAKVLHFRSVELAQSQNVPLVLKKWGGAEHSTQVMKEVMGMESGKVLAINSMARIEHVEIDSTDLNQGFEKFARHLKQNGLSWPQLLASAFTAGKTRIMMTCDSESLDTLLRTLERSKDLRKQRETLSSVSLTCFGGVSSDLPFKAIQILQHHGIIADKYVLSPHSVNLFVPVEPRGRSQRFAFADLVDRFRSKNYAAAQWLPKSRAHSRRTTHPSTCAASPARSARTGWDSQIPTELSPRTGGPHSHARIPVLKKTKDPFLWSKATRRPMGTRLWS